jgi:hypothetical protein|tara:strand:- start:33543 stop:33923 length:381 start_codon:yes stop_codon:yes gene_type:complete
LDPAFKGVLETLEPEFRTHFGHLTRAKFYTAVMAEFFQDAPENFYHHRNSSLLHLVEIDRALAERITERVDVPFGTFGFNAFRSFVGSPLMRESVYNRVKSGNPKASRFGLWFEGECAALGYPLAF